MEYKSNLGVNVNPPEHLAKFDPPLFVGIEPNPEFQSPKNTFADNSKLDVNFLFYFSNFND